MFEQLVDTLEVLLFHCTLMLQCVLRGLFFFELQWQFKVGYDLPEASPVTLELQKKKKKDKSQLEFAPYLSTHFDH